MSRAGIGWGGLEMLGSEITTAMKLAERRRRLEELLRLVEEQVQTVPAYQKKWIRQRLREIVSKHA